VRCKKDGRVAVTRASLALALVLVPAMATGAAAPAAAQEADPPEYAGLIDGALAEFQAGRWAEARALFQRAHAILPNARTLRGIGMAAFEMADYPAAADALEDALASEARPLTDEQREQVTTLLGRARLLIGRFVVPAASEDVRLSVDGVVTTPGGGWPASAGVIELGVGTHEVVMRDRDGHTSRVRVVVRGGEETGLELSPPSGATSSGSSQGGEGGGGDVTPWILAGVGAGVAIAGGVLYGVGAADITRVNNSTVGTEWSSVSGVYDSAPILTGVGLAALIGGLGVAVVGVGWGIAEAGSSDEGPRARVRLGPLGASVEGRF
jgi:hypothetical protein